MIHLIYWFSIRVDHLQARFCSLGSRSRRTFGGAHPHKFSLVSQVMTAYLSLPSVLPFIKIITETTFTVDNEI